MDVYFLRHGKANPSAPSGQDKDRELHPDGKKTIQKLAKTLNSFQIQFSKIFSSPHLRAKQTAEILSQNLNQSIHPETSSLLACGAHTQNILTLLQKEGNNSSILLVGHMPDLGEIITDLIHAKSAFSLKAGALCRLVLNLPIDKKHPAHLNLFLAPKDYCKF